MLPHKVRKKKLTEFLLCFGSYALVVSFAGLYMFWGNGQKQCVLHAAWLSYTKMPGPRYGPKLLHCTWLITRYSKQLLFSGAGVFTFVHRNINHFLCDMFTVTQNLVTALEPLPSNIKMQSATREWEKCTFNDSKIQPWPTKHRGSLFEPTVFSAFEKQNKTKRKTQPRRSFSPKLEESL